MAASICFLSIVHLMVMRSDTGGTTVPCVSELPRVTFTKRRAWFCSHDTVRPPLTLAFSHSSRPTCSRKEQRTAKEIL
jgi:hypothetical protein